MPRSTEPRLGQLVSSLGGGVWDEPSLHPAAPYCFGCWHMADGVRFVNGLTLIDILSGVGNASAYKDY